MLLKVNKSNFSGLTDKDASYINIDYIVSIEKNDISANISMVNGYSYTIDLESFDKIKEKMEIINE